MHTPSGETQAIEKEVVRIICAATRISPSQLLKIRDLTELGVEILDVVNIILRLEKTYQLTIPDEVPVYTLDDFVQYIYSHQTVAAH